MDKIYQVYQTTNHLTGKIYIGVTRKTKKKYKSYYGSSKDLKRDIKIYGENNFSWKCLYEYDNREEMFRKEAELVQLDEIRKRPWKWYNKMRGGNFCPSPDIEKTRENMLKALAIWNGSEGHKEHIKKIVEITRNKPTTEIQRKTRKENIKIALESWNGSEEHKAHILKLQEKNSILTKFDIPFIWEMLRTGFSHQEIADKFSVNRQVIYGIKYQRIWSNITNTLQPIDFKKRKNKRLKPEEIPFIWEMLREGLSCPKIADKFNVSSSTIQLIKTGKTWSHVTKDLELLN